VNNPNQISVKNSDGLPPTKQLISVNEARKLLGFSSNELGDDQIQEIIDSLSLIASQSLSKMGSKKSLGV
jgi:hypothetical protein